MDGIEAGVTCESENLYETDADLHNASINGDAEESEGSLEGEFCGRGFGRLAEDVFAQVAHDDYEADDDGENGLEEFVPNANQETCADERSEKRRQEQLQKDFFVQVAVACEIECAAEIPDDKSDAVCAVCDSRWEPEKNHDGEAKRGAASGDAVDEAYDSPQNKECRVLGVTPPVCHLASSFSMNFLLFSTFSRCVVSGNSARHLSSGAMASFSNFFFFTSSVCFCDLAKSCDVVLRCLLQ